MIKIICTNWFTYVGSIAYELKYGIKSYITEESRWLIDEYFKGFEKDTYTTADKLCGFTEFYKSWESYLDNKIVDWYEEKSGVRIPIIKPEDHKGYMSNRLKVRERSIPSFCLVWMSHIFVNNILIILSVFSLTFRAQSLTLLKVDLH